MTASAKTQVAISEPPCFVSTCECGAHSVNWHLQPWQPCSTGHRLALFLTGPPFRKFGRCTKGVLNSRSGSCTVFVRLGLFVSPSLLPSSVWRDTGEGLGVLPTLWSRSFFYVPEFPSTDDVTCALNPFVKADKKAA